MRRRLVSTTTWAARLPAPGPLRLGAAGHRLFAGTVFAGTVFAGIVVLASTALTTMALAGTLPPGSPSAGTVPSALSAPPTVPKRYAEGSHRSAGSQLAKLAQPRLAQPRQAAQPRLAQPRQAAQPRLAQPRLAQPRLAQPRQAAEPGHHGPLAKPLAGRLHLTLVWSHVLADHGGPPALSSPNVATLDGMPAVVFGDRAGHVYAFFLANGAPVPGWPANAGAPVDSTPSVAALNPASPDDTVFVGAGDAAHPHSGGYEAFNSNGSLRWYVRVRNPATDASSGSTSAVIASLSVGDLQGSTDVVAPSVGQEEYALNAATGKVLKGFPWFTADSGFSTPALANLYGNNKLEIVEGGDQTSGLAQWVQYSQGGHLRVLSPTGNAGTGSASGGLDCEYNADQVMESSPAVGPFLAGGRLGVVIGTGTYWKGASDTDKLLAFTTRCQLAWATKLDGSTASSPALAQLYGGGSFQVLEGTNNGRGGGSVYALQGATGKVIWRQNVAGEVIGSVVTAAVGNGDQYVVVPTTQGAELLDARTGAVLTTLEQGVGLQNAPLVTDDPDGSVGITLAGYTGQNVGVVEHFELAGSKGSNVDDYGTWPMFHHDPQLTGDVAEFNFSVPVSPAHLGKCRAPQSRPNGYYELNTAGRVWSYGNVAYCGSVRSRRMAGPAVGVAATPSGGGYWVADSAGQVFAFGDAHFYGPRRKMKLRSPIVAIAATPDGGGYWLVARDGAVFAFGDARFYGPKRRLHLSAPVSAIGVTADGRGYWLVARNGAIFTFGDAKAHSDAKQVGSDAVVGIAPDLSTGGYWLVSAGGRAWAFDAPYYGQVAGHGMADAMTAVAPLPDGDGYRVVDTGGELFCYGLATDSGTADTYNLAVPVVAIASPGG